MYEVFIPKKLGKIFKNNRLSVDERILLVRSMGGISYIYYKYPLYNPETGRIATITEICEANEDICMSPNLINPHCIESSISYLLEQCNYTEVGLPARYFNYVCDVTGHYYEFVFRNEPGYLLFSKNFKKELLNNGRYFTF